MDTLTRLTKISKNKSFCIWTTSLSLFFIWLFSFFSPHHTNPSLVVTAPSLSSTSLNPRPIRSVVQPYPQYINGDKPVLHKVHLLYPMPHPSQLISCIIILVTEFNPLMCSTFNLLLSAISIMIASAVLFFKPHQKPFTIFRHYMEHTIVCFVLKYNGALPCWVLKGRPYWKVHCRDWLIVFMDITLSGSSWCKQVLI